MKEGNKSQARRKAGVSMGAAFVSIAMVLVCVFSAGCLKFGNDEETTTPSAEQVARCRSEMYLHPGLRIRPLGYKLIGSGIDDAIWFKFGVDTSSPAEIFNTNVVDVSGFGDEFEVQAPSASCQWWDIGGKKIYGGSVSLPNVRFMNVGIKGDEGEAIVYIMWHEV